MNDNNLKKSFEKINMPEDCKAVALKDILQTAHSLRNKEKENYTMNNKWKFAIAGVSLIACITFAVLALPQIISTQEHPPQVAIDSPTPIQFEHDTAKITEPSIPEAYSQKLCSFAVQMGEYIYYSNPEDSDKLYKIREDGTDKTKLSNKKAENVQVVGDWVYFVNDYGQVLDDDSTTKGYAMIYKISVNGEEEACLYKAKKSVIENSAKEKPSYVAPGYDVKTIYDLVINNNTIYFYESFLEGDSTTGDLWDNWTDYICKMDIDGGNKTEITTNIKCKDLVVADDYIFYYDLHDYKLHRMRNDGTENIMFSDEYFISGFTIDDGWIYYSGDNFYDISTGKITDSKTADLAIYEKTANNNWSLYEKMVSRPSGFYKVRLDGTEKIKLSNKSVSNFIVGKGWIYYETCNRDISSICKMTTDGNEDQLLLDAGELISIDSIIGEILYYSSLNDYKLYKIKVDGTEKQEVELFK